MELTEDEVGICLLAIVKLDVLWPWVMQGSQWINASEDEINALIKKLAAEPG